MRPLLALAFVATLLFIGYSLFPDSGSAHETSSVEVTATAHPPESEDDVSTDAVAGEEGGVIGTGCHTEAGMYTCDHTHTPTRTPARVVPPTPTHTSTPTPRPGNGGGGGGGIAPAVPQDSEAQGRLGG